MKIIFYILKGYNFKNMILIYLFISIMIKTILCKIFLLMFLCFLYVPFTGQDKQS